MTDITLTHAAEIADVGQWSVTEDDKHYYQQRAEAEIALAQAAPHERAVRSHYLLAGYYLDLVHHDRLIGEGQA